MGINTLNALKRNERVKIIAGADLKRELCEKISSEHGIKTYSDYRLMLLKEKPDAVYVCTPDWSHFEPVMVCLDSGIHVHVEKPLTTNLNQARSILNKVIATGLKLQVAFNHRWLAPYHLTYNQIKQGKIGEPLMAYARKNNPISVPTKMIPWAKESSPMWFLSCHDIDLVTWWFEDDPVEVYGTGVKSVLKSKFGWDTYDAMQAIVKYKRGGYATFESTWIYPESHPALPDSFIEVVGSDGHVHLDRKTEAVELSNSKGISWPRSLLNYQVFDKWIGAFPSCINSFIDSIIEDRQPYVGANDGYKATLILDAVHKAINKNEIIKC